MSQDRISRMYQRIFSVIQEEMQGLVSDQLAAMMKGMGIDFARLQGMMSAKADFDPYAVMGLDSSASDDEIKKRYRELLRKLHPDTAGVEGTSFLLQLVLASYEIIKRERGWQ